MKIDVYDSYAQAKDGRLIHFDVLVEPETTKKQALEYGNQWLVNIGEITTTLEQARCNYCHSTIATPEIELSIRKNRYFIIQLEGCPTHV